MCDKPWILNTGFLVDIEDIIDIVFDSFEYEFITYLTDNAVMFYPAEFDDAEDDHEYHDCFSSLDDEDKLIMIAHFFRNVFNVDAEPSDINLFIGNSRSIDFVPFHTSFTEMANYLVDATGIDFSDYEFIVFGSDEEDDE